MPPTSAAPRVPAGSEMSDWIEHAARAGYTAKGVVYAVVGIIAIRAALGGRADTAGSREALRFVESGPFGNVLLGLVAVGLAGYVIWRLVQAVANPEGDEDDGTAKEVGMRVFYLASAVIYSLLAFAALQMLVDSGGGGGSGGSGMQERVRQVMGWPGGRFLVGAAGLGMIARGVKQGIKAYTQDFMDRISAFDLTSTQRTGVVATSRVGLTARGVVFGIIGGLLIQAALTHDPSEAQSTQGALQVLADQPWLLGAVGAGMLCYAAYQWVKARYRLISV